MSEGRVVGWTRKEQDPKRSEVSLGRVERSGPAPTPFHDLDAEALSRRFSLPLIRLSGYPNRPHLMKELSIKFLREHVLFPLDFEEGLLRVACANPADVYGIDALRAVVHKPLSLYVSPREDVLEAVEKFYGSTMGEIIEGISTEDGIAEGANEEDVEHLRDMAAEAPVIRLVNLFLSKAIEGRASDVHIEPFEEKLYVRFRIDGMLQDQESPPKRLQSAIISRVKIMAKLNIAERRLPQDGRIRVKIAGKDIDIRVSTVPTIYGESVVMRLLDRGSIVINLEKLGFPSDSLHRFYELIAKPYGIILVTGPTGSGKTTTLYGALEKINTPEKKIITVEDPVEYQLEGVNQIQVKPQIGLTFASGLRHIVRQDPDVIMIGEIRDAETAEIAIESALTGHLVFSTLHTNDSAGAVTRLLDMRVEHYLLASTVEGILAQRLVRTLCPLCKEAYTPSRELVEELGVRELTQAVRIYRPTGCEECAHSGYKGRIGIFELLVVDEEIRNLILQKSGTHVIRNKAIDHGLRLLREDGWDKVEEGITSVEEVLRVTQESI